MGRSGFQGQAALMDDGRHGSWYLNRYGVFLQRGNIYNGSDQRGLLKEDPYGKGTRPLIELATLPS